ncbi:hypothetical protein L195_g044901, partial [Trifolium pratense]
SWPSAPPYFLVLQQLILHKSGCHWVVFDVTTMIVPFSRGSSGGLVVVFAVGVLAFGSVCLFTIVSAGGCWLLVMEQFNLVVF